MTAEPFGLYLRTTAGCATAAVCVFLFSSVPASAQFFWDGGDGPFWDVSRSLRGTTNTGLPARNLAIIGGGTEAWPGSLKIGAPAVATNDAGSVFSFADFSASQSSNVPAANVWRGGWLFNDGGFAQQLEIVPGSAADPGDTNFYFGVISVTDPITGSNMFVQLVDLRTNTAAAGQSPVASNRIEAGASRAPVPDSRVVLAIAPSRISGTPAGAGGILTNFSSRAAVTHPNAAQGGGLPGATNAGTGSATGRVLHLAGGFTNNVAGGPDSVGLLLSSSEVQFTLIPEPSVAILWGSGVLLLAGLSRRKRLQR